MQRIVTRPRGLGILDNTYVYNYIYCNSVIRTPLSEFLVGGPGSEVFRVQLNIKLKIGR